MFRPAEKALQALMPPPLITATIIKQSSDKGMMMKKRKGGRTEKGWGVVGEQMTEFFFPWMTFFHLDDVFALALTLGHFLLVEYKVTGSRL